jgi:ribosomal protein L12E/L44/L45/RPP1/RPP2
MSRISDLKRRLDDFSESSYFWEWKVLKENYNATDEIMQEFKDKVLSQSDFMNQRKFRLKFEESSYEWLWIVSLGGKVISSDAVEGVIEELEIPNEELEQWLKQLVNTLETDLEALHKICTKELSDIIQKYSLDTDEKETTFSPDLISRFNKIAEESYMYQGRVLLVGYNATDEIFGEFIEKAVDRSSSYLSGCEELGITLEDSSEDGAMYIGLCACSLDEETLKEALEELEVENPEQWLRQVVEKLEKITGEIDRVFTEEQEKVIEKYGLTYTSNEEFGDK